MNNTKKNTIDGFYWGNSNKWFRETIGREIFQEKMYEKYFKVEENDVVLDVGASIGPFSYTLKNRNIKHLYCIEPSLSQVEILKENIGSLPSTIIPYAIGLNDLEIEELFVLENNSSSIVKAKEFKTIIKENNIEKIDFLKTDCEGGEYNIFTPENLFWIKDNVKKISGEWHLNTPETKHKFREFRDIYLKLFPNYEVHSVCGIDIKWDLWNEHFIEYYNEIIIYIDNR